MMDPCSDVRSNKWLFVWRSANLLLGIFFLAATLLQLNDHDFYVWIPIYAVPAILCFAITLVPRITEHWIWKLIAVLMLLVCCGYAIYTAVVLVETHGNHPSNFMEHEEGRELAGLIIVVVYLVIYRFTPLSSGFKVERKRDAKLIAWKSAPGAQHTDNYAITKSNKTYGTTTTVSRRCLSGCSKREEVDQQNIVTLDQLSQTTSQQESEQGR